VNNNNNNKYQLNSVSTPTWVESLSYSCCNNKCDNSIAASDSEGNNRAGYENVVSMDSVHTAPM